MKYLSLALLSAFILLLGVSCDSNRNKNTAPDPLVSHIDSSVRPVDDFFLFANGKWFAHNPIPASEKANGLWLMIQDTINNQVLSVCQTSAKLTDAPKGSNKQKIGDFYYTAMDSVTRNKKGIDELKPLLAKIDEAASLDEFARVASELRPLTSSALFSLYVSQDDRISSKNAVMLNQGGLSLRERSYYLDKDNRTTEIRRKFVDYMNNMFVIMGYSHANAAKAAAATLELETNIARTSRKIEDTRDPLKNYSKLSFKQLAQQAPSFNWEIFTENAGLHSVDSVIVGQPEFIAALNGYLKKFPLDNWKNYLKIQLVNDLSPYLDDKTFIESFNFFSKTLTGVVEPKPRWKRAVEQADGYLGELIGQVYVKEYLPEGTKEKLLEIGNAIRKVYAQRMSKLDWMSPKTKEKAIEKLNSIVMKVGYPDKWKDMSALQIDRNSYVQNVMNARRWRFNYMTSKYGKPVDRTEWNMYPQTYNAYYNPSNNEICVPGCNIIIPGYEHVLADDALLYSVIGGSTFGHEITHGFDDQGSKYNKEGNLQNWWTAEDSIKFYAKTKLIVEQYNNYIAVDSLHINGEMTQGENIADLGGISMGFEAFRNTSQFKNNVMIGRVNPTQRFFLGYALAWMINMRPQAIANQVKTDVHSPVKFRVNGPLSDMPEFYEAFGVKKGDGMWLPDDKRVSIW